MVKTALGIEENIEAALCYLGLWLTGIIFYFLDNKNKNIRFHAMQSILVFLPLTILMVICWWIPVVGGILWWVFLVLMLILWIILMIKAFQNEKFKVPIVGDLAEKHS
jgi:uncharacterized membrane protein